MLAGSNGLVVIVVLGMGLRTLILRVKMRQRHPRAEKERMMSWYGNVDLKGERVEEG